VVNGLKILEKTTDSYIQMFEIDRANFMLNAELGILEFYFTRDDVKHTATLPIQILGTYNETTHIWKWAWDNPSIPVAVQQLSQQLKTSCPKCDALTTNQFVIPSTKVWDLVATAVHRTGYSGAYRCPNGNLSAYVLFKEVNLS